MSPLDVTAGDRLVFLVNMHGNIGFDTTAFNPTITYEDGETHTASGEFSGEQGKSGWRYQYIEDGKFVDLVYYPEHKQWRKTQDNATGTPFVGAGNQHPDAGQDAVRVWTAPKAGRVRVTGIGLQHRQRVRREFGLRLPAWAHRATRRGTRCYDRDTGDGLFIGWDYFGHWASSFELQPTASITAQLKVAGHKQTLAPGESRHDPEGVRRPLPRRPRQRRQRMPRLAVPLSVGLHPRGMVPGDPDARLLDARAPAGASRASAGPAASRTWTAPSARSSASPTSCATSAQTSTTATGAGGIARATGTARTSARPASTCASTDMGQLIYAFLYTVDPESKVAKEHPDWVLGRHARHVRARSRRVHRGATRRFRRALGRLRVAQRQLLHQPAATATTRRCSARTRASARSSGTSSTSIPAARSRRSTAAATTAATTTSATPRRSSSAMARSGILAQLLRVAALPARQDERHARHLESRQVRQGDVARRSSASTST